MSLIIRGGQDMKHTMTIIAYCFSYMQETLEVIAKAKHLTDPR